jgi:gamma-glutamyltranspeptidase/glutathione hydrolase
VNYNGERKGTRESGVVRGSIKRGISVLLQVAALAAIAAHAQQPAPERATGWTDKSPVTSRQFMVAAANPHAVAAGYRILKQGGSAVDAAIAVQLVLNVVEPQSSGIGGGAFMLVHDGRRNRLVAYDGRETAPAAARPDRFLGADGRPMGIADAVVGGRSVGVPGVVALLAEAHRRHGRLPWAVLVAPAIALAEDGFAISPRLAKLIAAERHFVQPRARAYFLEPDGRPRAAGTILRNPDFARTLRAIASQGDIAFYRGEIARDVVETADGFAPNPGDLTLADLANYRIRIRNPVCNGYRQYRVCGMPPPSSGGTTLLQMLGMLEPYDLASMGPASFWSVHFFSEAGRLAHADRGVYIADPDFVTPPAGLLDGDYLRERSLLIRADSSLGVALPGNPPAPAKARNAAWGKDTALERPSTSHSSIVDRDGNAVAMTTTIEDAFGSRLMTAGGFLLNNQLTDFSFLPSENGLPVANRIEAGKRPRSSMSPTIVYDRSGRVAIVVGSAGGPPIINHVAKTIVAIVDWGLDPQAAVALPNFGSRNGPTDLEQGTTVAAFSSKLEALGSGVSVREFNSGTQAIVRTTHGWIAGADPRREGTAMGD